ncbi:dephospho-CoA kinase [Kineococcus gypseus]|uniref:dephospho-CoA kinase n=1 Tax=Kineococcus gypseus TaxID=1637102 RepID=UPI003D7E63A1
MPDLVLGPGADTGAGPGAGPVLAPGAVLGTAAVVQALAARLAATPAPAAGPRVVLVDGRSGSGKTSLAAALAPRLGAAVVHLDELYPGWDGLAAGVGVLAREVLAPLRAGRTAAPARWDWGAGRWGPAVPVPAAPVVVCEGVGAGCAGPGELLVQLSAPGAVRRRRALARDGSTYAPHWRRWAAQEEELFARHDVAGAADVVLDGSGDERAGEAGRWRVLRA